MPAPPSAKKPVVNETDRPYFKLRADELASLFHSAKTSPETLSRLRHELLQRSTPRARQLLNQVQSVLNAARADEVRQEPLEIDESVVQTESKQPLPDTENGGFPPISPLPESAAGVTSSAVAGEPGRRSAILQYWRAVEVFNPQKMPRTDPRSREEPTYQCRSGEPGPWDASHVHKRRRPPQNCLWRFVVYGGIFPTRLISSRLEEVFGRDPEVFDERVDGESGAFSIALTHRGEPLIESFVLSSAAWALGRLKNPGPKIPGWLSGFEVCEGHIRSYLENLFVRASEDEQPSPPIGRVATAGELFAVCRRIIEFLGLDPCDFSPNLIIRCQPVSFKKYKSTDDLDVLNSFFIRDLQQVANGVASGECGQALAAYLQQPNANVASRVDLRKQSALDLYWEKLQPDKYPEARWPSSGHHPLVYSQQIAVNELFSHLKDNSGLFGINGPPGTGKTTLLRDVLAGVIVERAKALATLSQPEEAFISHENWKTEGFTRRINIFQDSIGGHGMVVASANNGAVENVTLELPSSEAIDESWRANVDHFGKHASRLLNAQAWGLIAARLGNKANRREFLKRFWYDEDDDERGSQDDGFLSYLKEIEGTPVDWSESVRQFQTVVKGESKVRENRRKVWEAVIKDGELKKQQREAKDQLSVLDQQRRDAEAEKEKASVAFGMLHLRAGKSTR